VTAAVGTAPPAGTPAAESTPIALTVDTALDQLLAQWADGEEPLLVRIERELISRAVKTSEGDVAKAAKLLGLTKAALQKRLKET